MVATSLKLLIALKELFDRLIRLVQLNSDAGMVPVAEQIQFFLDRELGGRQ